MRSVEDREAAVGIFVHAHGGAHKWGRSGLIYRRTIRTDTLVGSRGDRPDTLVRSAVAQVVDVVAPRLREHLAAAAEKP